MKRRFAFFTTAIIIVVLASSGTMVPRRSSARTPHALGLGSVSVDPDFGKIPLYFIPNQGQLDAQVAYYIQGKDKAIYFTSEGLTYVLDGKDVGEEKGKGSGSKRKRLPMVKGGEKPRNSSRFAVKLDFVGANADVLPSGEEKTGAVISYFKGKPEEWKAGLPSYSRIVYKNLWPGIDAAYFGTVDKLKYEFIVHPGSDPSLIRLAYRGASAVEVNNEGRLEVKTPAGGFEDDRPVGYQEVNGHRVNVALKYLLDAQSMIKPGPGGKEAETKAYVYGFNVGAYDRTKPLVLDPAVLVYCGYIGGNDLDDEYGFDIAVDVLGNAYVSGCTYSAEATFPVTEGPDLTYNGDRDAFVAKVNASGTALVYCGYIGGSEADFGYGIAVDGSGNAYVSGRTLSTQATFPVVVGPDLTHNGGWDAFVAKVNASGTALDYCGYIGGGGSGEEYAYDVAVDSSGNAYVVGSTYCTEYTFPVTVGPDLTNNGDLEAFVAKVNASGSALDYCGYIGGSGADFGYGIAVDGSGNAYVSGGTYSTEATFPVVVGPDLTHNGGRDAFVAKVNASGTALVYCGYIGGFGDEIWNDRYGGNIAIDSLGNAYVTGYTNSTEDSFPVIVGPDLTHNGGLDAFVAKVNASGTALVYCGYIGGAGDDAGWGIAVDGSGNAYVTGGTTSTEGTFPVSGGPDLTQNGDQDAFVARVNASGTALDFCGFIGGAASDKGLGIAVDGSGNAYVAGATSSSEATFPVTGGPDLTYGGGPRDAFVAKISYIGPSATLTVTSPNGGESWEAGSSRNITWTSASVADVKIEYSANSGSSYTTIIASTPNSDSYAWTVPYVVSANCLIRISDASNAAVNDVSNEAFSIVASAPIVVTSPAGGEAWIIGTTQPITWFSSGVSGNLNINLYKGTSSLGAIATGIPVGNGVYNWKAGYLKNGTSVAVGSTYRVSIASAANGNIKAISKAYFSLVKPKISVKTPVSGTVWKANSVQRISWTYTAVSGTVNIFLYRFGILKGQVAASVPVSDLGFSWTVGTLNTGQTAPIGAGYSVRVKTSDGKVSGKSPGTFTIRR